MRGVVPWEIPNSRYKTKTPHPIDEALKNPGANFRWVSVDPSLHPWVGNGCAKGPRRIAGSWLQLPRTIHPFAPDIGPGLKFLFCPCRNLRA